MNANRNKVKRRQRKNNAKTNKGDRDTTVFFFEKILNVNEGDVMED